MLAPGPWPLYTCPMQKQLRYTPYIDQAKRWPDQGRVILAQYDDDCVVVYQAYRKSIGRAAAAQNTLAVDGFRMDRMSWIKPNFLWMMYRSKWATDTDQRVVLAIWITRDGFEEVLRTAVHTKYLEGMYPSRAAWQAALDASEVRLQWDPDHDPRGTRIKRRAIQLGLSGSMLERFVHEWTVQVENITGFVTQQARFQHDTTFLFTPYEKVYPVRDEALTARLGLDKSALGRRR